MIKCDLIDIDDENRAVIAMGYDKNGKVTSVPLSSINYRNNTFIARNGKVYKFG